MYCEDSQEGLFTSLLSKASKFEFTARGKLVLSFRDRPGQMSFRAVLI